MVNHMLLFPMIIDNEAIGVLGAVITKQLKYNWMIQLEF